MSFEIPDFLAGETVDKIHKEMCAELPSDIDASAGGLVWDLTRPTAVASSRTAQMTIPMAMMQIWAQFATGIYLDYHAGGRKMSRRLAQHSTVYLLITGRPGTHIPVNSVFSTVEKETNFIQFKIVEEVTLAEYPVLVRAEAVEAGRAGNVAANTVIMVISGGLNGITEVTNPNSAYGGFDEESDDELRQRIRDFDASSGESHIGNPSDYKRWAMSVPGVGEAKVISAQDTSGTVQIILTDSNGNQASEELRQSVYDYIMGTNNPLGQRLAPTNAVLEVKSPEIISVTIDVVVELTEAASLSGVKSDFMSAIRSYINTAHSEGEIRFTRIGSILGMTKDVRDYRNLTLNGGSSNIEILPDQMISIEANSVNLSEGQVPQ